MEMSYKRLQQRRPNDEFSFHKANLCMCEGEEGGKMKQESSIPLRLNGLILLSLHSEENTHTTNIIRPMKSRHAGVHTHTIKNNQLKESFSKLQNNFLHMSPFFLKE